MRFSILSVHSNHISLPTHHLQRAIKYLSNCALSNRKRRASARGRRRSGRGPGGGRRPTPDRLPAGKRSSGLRFPRRNLNPATRSVKKQKSADHARHLGPDNSCRNYSVHKSLLPGINHKGTRQKSGKNIPGFSNTNPPHIKSRRSPPNFPIAHMFPGRYSRKSKIPAGISLHHFCPLVQPIISTHSQEIPGCHEVRVKYLSTIPFRGSRLPFRETGSVGCQARHAKHQKKEEGAGTH